MKKYFLFILYFALLISCRPKPIDIKVNAADTKLVAFSQIIPDNAMIVTLTKSFSPLSGNTTADFTDLLVSGATIKVTSNGLDYSFYELKPGVYSSYNIVPFQEGQVFYLEASFGDQTITSTSTMMKKKSFTTVLPRLEKHEKDTSIFVDFSFDDIQGEPNWYLINFYKKQSVSTDFTNYFANGSNIMTKSILISDKEFNSTYANSVQLQNIFHDDSIAVTLSNISEQYFNYLSYRVNNGSVLNQLNVEPINYPTNILNGYGFFNTHSPDIHFFDLKEY